MAGGSEIIIGSFAVLALIVLIAPRRRLRDQFIDILEAESARPLQVNVGAELEVQRLRNEGVL